MCRKFIRLALMAMTFGLLSCSEDSGEVPPPVKDVWGITYSHKNLGAYPDLFSNYWVYAYETTKNPNVGLRISGEYPDTRFFSFSIYNDMTGEVIDGLDDVHIIPDNGSINPYLVTTESKGNKFTVYLLKEGTDLSLFPGAKDGNVCYFTDDVKCLTLCLRHYLGVDEFGGVSLPIIEGVDLKTGKVVATPEAVVSRATVMKQGNYEPVESDTNNEVPFLLAPRGAYFPNNSTDYLFCRTKLTTDQVLRFSFIPVPVPNNVEEYQNAKARYWSICIGSVQNTFSYSSFYDKMLEYPENEKITVIVVSANNPKLAEVKKAAKKIPYSYVMEWDETIVDAHGKAIGDIFAIMYRNILPDKTWENSIKNMEPIESYSDPYSKVVNPDKQIAHIALGDYGPLGVKQTTDEFLNTK